RIESDRPELMMGRLPHLELRHPIKNLAWIQITKFTVFKLKQERRMNRITEIEQDVRSGQTVTQSFSGYPDAIHRVEVVLIPGVLVIEQAIIAAESVLA